MGRPRKPSEAKRRLGNPGKRPLPDLREVVSLPTVAEAPEPLWPLSEDGMAAWEWAWEHSSSWLAHSDIGTLQLYCVAIDDYVTLRTQLYATGFTNPELWRERKQLADLRAQVGHLGGQLGFTPASRAQLGVAEVGLEAVRDDSLLNRSPLPTIRRIPVLKDGKDPD